MNRTLTASLLALALLAGASCGTDGGDDAIENGGRVEVVAAFHPLAELARRIGGDRVLVTDLTPAGSEPHDLELSPRDLDRIVDADVVLHGGDEFQPTIADAAGQAKGQVVDVATAAGAVPGSDPHFWLDPEMHRAAARAVLTALVGVDRDGARAHRERARELDRALSDVMTEMEEGLHDCARDTIVTAHAAFGRLADRFDLEQQAITGISPEAEPDPKRLDELATLVEREGITTVFTEELVAPDVADSLAREAGVRTAVLDTLEGPADDGAPYEDRMLANLAALRDALECA